MIFACTHVCCLLVGSCWLYALLPIIQRLCVHFGWLVGGLADCKLNYAGE